jgi:hypothetical protein
LEATNICNSSTKFPWVGWLLLKVHQNFSKIAEPITKLLKKGIKYAWSEDCDDAFQALKKLLTTSPVLAQPDIAKFSMYTVMLLALDWDVS